MQVSYHVFIGLCVGDGVREWLVMWECGPDLRLMVRICSDCSGKRSTWSVTAD